MRLLTLRSTCPEFRIVDCFSLPVHFTRFDSLIRQAPLKKKKFNSRSSSSNITGVLQGHHSPLLKNLHYVHLENTVLHLQNPGLFLPPAHFLPLFFSCVYVAVSFSIREGILQGQQDYDLTPIGVKQAEATRTRLRGNEYWEAHSSDLVRASRTAEIILEGHDHRPVVTKSPLLREFGLGVLEDLPRGTTW